MWMLSCILFVFGALIGIILSTFSLANSSLLLLEYAIILFRKQTKGVQPKHSNNIKVTTNCHPQSLSTIFFLDDLQGQFQVSSRHTRHWRLTRNNWSRGTTKAHLWRKLHQSRSFFPGGNALSFPCVQCHLLVKLWVPPYPDIRWGRPVKTKKGWIITRKKVKKVKPNNK